MIDSEHLTQLVSEARKKQTEFEHILSNVAKFLVVPIHVARAIVDMFGKDPSRVGELQNISAQAPELKSPIDQAIVQFVRANPGVAVSTKQICKHTRKSARQLIPHLRKLVNLKIITRMRRGFYSFDKAAPAGLVVADNPSRSERKPAKAKVKEQSVDISQYGRSCKKIYRLLSTQERSITELAQKMGFTASSVHYSLKQLMKGGFVKKVKRGTYGLA